MIIHCARCGRCRELHKGRLTGGSLGEYLNVLARVKRYVEPQQQLCIDCLKALLLRLEEFMGPMTERVSGLDTRGVRGRGPYRCPRRVAYAFR